MKPEVLFLSAYVALFSFAFVGTTAAADSKLEKAVRDADAEWSKVATAKDLDKTVAFYADDAVVLPPNQSAVTNKDGIRNLWKGFLDSFVDISWKTTRLEVAKSGDMAVLTGTYQMTMKDGSKDKGKYCEVWQRKPTENGKLEWTCSVRICRRSLHLRLGQALRRENKSFRKART
jgi:ketosteroid isomerase-like protein